MSIALESLANRVLKSSQLVADFQAGQFSRPFVVLQPNNPKKLIMITHLSVEHERAESK